MGLQLLDEEDEDKLLGELELLLDWMARNGTNTRRRPSS